MNASEEHVCFYYEIGVGITQWAHVERSILEVVGACVTTTDFNAIAHGFFAIENFRSKLSFADSIVRKSQVNASTTSEWNTLVNRAEIAAKLRNRIAHLSVMGYPSNAAGRRYCLQPRIPTKLGKPSKTPKPPSGAMCLSEIVAARYTFFALMVSLQNYASRLRGQAETFPTSAEKPQRPPSIKTMKLQLQGLVGAQPK